MVPAHKCSEDCLFVNRDGTIICRKTGICRQQYICRNDFKPKAANLFVDFETKKQNARARGRIYNVSRKKPRQLLCSEEPRHMNADIEKQFIEHLLDKLVGKDTNAPLSIVKEVLALFGTLHDKQALEGKRQAIAIAALYLMKKGKVYNTLSGTRYSLPQSNFLCDHLPHIGDLRFLGISKNLVRIGTNCIQDIIRNI